MAARPKVLVVEDKHSEREALTRLLRMHDFDVVTSEDADKALSFLDEPVDLVISDLRMGENSGLDLLRYWKQKRHSTPFIMVTGYGAVDSAVEAMKLGAADYLTKPVNPDELLILVNKCLDLRKKDEQIKNLQERLDQRLGFERIIGSSPAMLEVFDLARRAAEADSTVLITGESGTGKELIAEAIHHNSPHKEGPFVAINMAAVPETLVESELFGHVKGAFTGATGSRVGRFEAADGGTLFLDEIGDLKMMSQAKLLRVLESNKITPVGSNEDRHVDVRVVAATSRNLQELVANGDFREDLYYRFNVVAIALPPLRQRREDIPLLVRHFLDELCAVNGKPRLDPDPELMNFLENHDWPGNVRQLANCIESMVVLATSTTLTLDNLPATVRSNHQRTGVEREERRERTLADMERRAVLQALDQNGGNRTQAASALGISVRTLQRKLKIWNAAVPVRPR